MTLLDPNEIKPLHAPTSRSLLLSLTEDMRENGWTGRPLLVIERKLDYLAWTGSHRIEAARLAGLSDIPVHVLKEEEMIKRGFDAEQGHVEDRERLAILTQIGDETALHIMWLEGRPL